jgi:mRNA-degrading endonuclease RelE of RelBE toxin-antitoxin system
MELKQGPAYYVEISEKASQDLEALAGEARDLLDGLRTPADEALDTIHDALDALETNPRPPGARRRSAPGHYSLRVGPHRVHYAIDEEARLITVQRIIRDRRRRSP